MEHPIAAALTVSLAESKADLEDILRLQEKNLPQHLSREQIMAGGFVTVAHSMELLMQMNKVEKIIIARSDGRLAGYCLAMPESFRNTIRVLAPMFEEMDRLRYKGVPLTGKLHCIGPGLYG